MGKTSILVLNIQKYTIFKSLGYSEKTLHTFIGENFFEESLYVYKKDLSCSNELFVQSNWTKMP